MPAGSTVGNSKLFSFFPVWCVIDCYFNIKLNISRKLSLRPASGWVGIAFICHLGIMSSILGLAKSSITAQTTFSAYPGGRRRFPNISRLFVIEYLLKPSRLMLKIWRYLFFSSSEPRAMLRWANTAVLPCGINQSKQMVTEHCGDEYRIIWHTELDEKCYVEA